MRKIYKYPIKIEDEFTLELPKNSHILSFQVKNGTPCIWILLDNAEPNVNVNFKLFGTGHNVTFEQDYVFVDTIQLDGFVWHLFVSL